MAVSMKHSAIVVWLSVCVPLTACDSMDSPEAGPDAGGLHVLPDAGPSWYDAGPCACTEEAPLCDLEQGRCVGCFTSEDCPRGRPVCDLDAQVCVSCTTSADCEDLTNPVCTVSGACGRYAAASVSLGESHACVTTTTGSVVCWGMNEFGQLGDGTIIDRNHPVEARDLSDVVAVSAGHGHTCALMGSGAVKCWGNNEFGQLGDGTSTSRREPADVLGLSAGVVAVSAGGWHTCALLESGGVRCWGRNEEGQVGAGPANVTAPADVPGLASISDVTAGGWFTCARETGGDEWCWGDNSYGQFGNATTSGGPIPVPVVSWAYALTLDAGRGHMCALFNGLVRCSGSNRFGELGIAAIGGTRARPHQVVGLSRPLAVSAGGSHTCAILGDRTVQCWGRNQYGQLGNETTLQSRSTPVDVLDLEGAVDVAAGSGFNCAVLEGGGVACWGLNTQGQLGASDARTGSAYMHPQSVIGF